MAAASVVGVGTGSRRIEVYAHLGAGVWATLLHVSKPRSYPQLEMEIAVLGDFNVSI